MDAPGWDERYAATDLVWSKGPNQFLPPVTAGLPLGSALDLACGEGRNAIWLATQGWEVTAVDFSTVGIDKGRELAGATAVNWVASDVTTYRPNQQFDLVLVFYLHLLADEFEHAITTAVDSVADGGALFCVGHALRNLSDGHGGPPVPDILWTKSLFADALADLSVVELGERLRQTPDGDAIDFVVHATRNAPGKPRQPAV